MANLMRELLNIVYFLNMIITLLPLIIHWNNQREVCVIILSISENTLSYRRGLFLFSFYF